MKFWQILPFCHKNPQALKKVFQSGEWEQYRQSFLDAHTIIDQQQRAILDQVLPDGLAVAILEHDQSRIFRSDGYLRLQPLSPDDESLSTLTVYTKYGGAILDEVFEYGLVKI